jgi:hypothetical protein
MVPRPAALVTSTWPPSASMRSRSPRSPDWVAVWTAKPLGNVTSALISSAIAVAGFGTLGVRTLATSDDAWDHVPAITAEPVPQPYPSGI